MSRALLLLAVLCAACVTRAERPIHPLQLEGFPGALIEPDLFPLRAGMRWTFQERIGEERTLELRVVQRGGQLFLHGRQEGEVSIALESNFLELRYQGRILEQPLLTLGQVGDSWGAARARYTVFGYDEVEVLGKRVRALVVAADRPPVRDLYWFAEKMGWIRFRTERNGRVYRDAILTGFDPGGAN